MNLRKKMAAGMKPTARKKTKLNRTSFVVIRAGHFKLPSNVSASGMNPRGRRSVNDATRGLPQRHGRTNG